MLEKEGIIVSRSAISLFLKRYRETGRKNDAPCSGRKPKLTNENLEFIDEKWKKMMNWHLGNSRKTFPVWVRL